MRGSLSHIGSQKKLKGKLKELKVNTVNTLLVDITVVTRTCHQCTKPGGTYIRGSGKSFQLFNSVCWALHAWHNQTNKTITVLHIAASSLFFPKKYPPWSII